MYVTFGEIVYIMCIKIGVASYHLLSFKLHLQEDWNTLQPMSIKLTMYDFKQCDPKRCSGQRLVNKGYMRSIP